MTYDGRSYLGAPTRRAERHGPPGSRVNSYTRHDYWKKDDGTSNERKHDRHELASKRNTQFCLDLIFSHSKTRLTGTRDTVKGGVENLETTYSIRSLSLSPRLNSVETPHKQKTVSDTALSRASKYCFRKVSLGSWGRRHSIW